MSNNPVVKRKYSTAAEPPADLFVAAIFDDLALMEKALSQGKSINAIHSTTGKTPVHLAACWGSLQFIVRAAQIPDFDPTIFDNNGHSAYSYAALRKDVKIKKILGAAMERTQHLPDLE
jgi:ankyrin repeat protein